MKRLASAALVISMVVATFTATSIVSSPAVAANAAQFDPGNIISDAVMYNGSALSAGQVQDFLVQQEGKCSSTCMANYRQNTPSMPATTWCGAYQGSGSERAADIIAKVGAACNISQKSLLVLIQKEQSLVTAVSPALATYGAATGFGCPDTAGCDPAVAGFFYQIYFAARQFQIYAKTPTQWNYQAGRVNQILYSPKTQYNCGSSPVFIQNKATAGLYIYTPYQPDAAALANLYGNGGNCSSYGNRNFWRIFTDWFGSPTAASSLVRTTADATVYLVSDANKYPIGSLSILAALAPLGQVSYVSQSYLDGFATSHLVGRSLRGPDGSIYFYDSGIKLPFTSCAQAADYGASCDISGYVQLNEGQISAFVTGPVLSNVMGTVEGSRYYVKSGTKSEILDDASQAAAGIPAGMNVLTENAVASLPLTPPIVVDGSYASTRGTSNYSLISSGARLTISAASATSIGAASRTFGSLSAASLALIPQGATAFSGIVSGATASSTTVLTPDGQYDLTAGGLSPTSVPVSVPQRLLGLYANRGTISAGSFIKSPDNGTVYIVMPTDIRPVSSWDALLALTTNGSPVIVTVSPALVGLLTHGPVALTAGTLVRSPDDATVYFINGVTNRIALSYFDYPVDAGFGTLVFSTTERIQAYPLAPSLMTFGFGCGTDDYIAGGGALHLVSLDLLAAYPFTYVPMDQFTCGQMKKGSPATSFVRTPDGSIYQIAGGKKLPVASMARYAQISAGAGWTEVSTRFASQYATGPLA